jgi:hypothetical protein
MLYINTQRAELQRIVLPKTFTWYQSQLPKIASMCLASSSSTVAAMTNLLAGLSVSEKLTRRNYLLWQSQVHPPLCGARLLGDGL